MRKLVSGITIAALLIMTSVMPGESSEAFASSKQDLFINEVMASNKSTIRDGDTGDPVYGSQGGAYSDWIEIYNSGAINVDLSGYTISNDSTPWVFSKGVVPAKGYLLVWASNKDKIAPDGQLHTNFKISSSGETITLKDPKGILVDSVKTCALANDNSYGREEDASNNFVIFKKATPGSANKEGTNIVKAPTFSCKGGFYTSEFTLKLSSDDAGTEIYYTKDGSDPVPGAVGTNKYTNGITIKSRAGDPNVISVFENTVPVGEVFKCSIIKAVSVKEDGSMSKIITNSYFVDPSIRKKFDLPVISLVTDNSNFFDRTKGIYTMNNCDNSGPEWERPIHVEFFEKNGDFGFSQYCGVRLNGLTSKSFPQKALRLYADREYDDTNKIDYKIFPGLVNEVSGKPIESFERLLLRASGSDCSRTMFRDALVHSLAKEMKLDTQAYRPCQVFLNGEYWGLYNIRERYDNKYFASHYNLDKDKFALLEYGLDYQLYGKLNINEGTKEDEQAYLNDVVKYVETNSLSEESNYDYIKTKVDIDNFIDYMIVNIFAANQDWPESNFAMWRYKTDDGMYHPEAPYGQDGRWRYIIKDCDMSFGQWGISDANADTLSRAMQKSILGKFMENSNFRNKFINRFEDCLNTVFDSNYVVKRIDNMSAAIESSIPDEINRWQLIKDWPGKVQLLRDFATQRPDYVRQQICNKFNVPTPTPTPISVLKGDLNDDKKINSTDYSILKRVILTTWTNSYNKDNADMNSDTKINSTDLSLLKRKILAGS